jgi:hypothetical protein
MPVRGCPKKQHWVSVQFSIYRELSDKIRKIPRHATASLPKEYFSVKCYRFAMKHSHPNLHEIKWIGRRDDEDEMRRDHRPMPGVGATNQKLLTHDAR